MQNSKDHVGEGKGEKNVKEEEIRGGRVGQ